MNEPDAARRFGFDGEIVPGVGFAGTRITAVVRPDPVEVARREELDPITLQLLETAPPGVVEDTATAVIRRWRPALFAPDAPRGIVLRHPPSDEQALRDEAIELGVGVIAPDSEGDWGLLVNPLRDTRYDLGPRHWRLLEITYLAWREHTYAARTAQLFR